MHIQLFRFINDEISLDEIKTFISKAVLDQCSNITLLESATVEKKMKKAIHTHNLLIQLIDDLNKLE